MTIDENQQSQDADDLIQDSDQTEKSEDELETRDIVKNALNESKKTKSRDEIGKFVKAENQEDPTQSTNAESTKQEEIPKKQRNYISSYKQDVRDFVSTLPDNIQDAFQAREDAFHRGLDQYRDLAAKGKDLGSAFEPFDEYLNQIGATRQQAITHLLNAEKTLRTGSQEEKTNAFLKMAYDYGLDVNTLANTQFDPSQHLLQQKIAQLENQLYSLSTASQQSRTNELESTIQEFAKEKEYFDDLRNEMAVLLENNLASNLDEAYNIALRMNESVFNRYNAAQQKQQLINADKIAKTAKQAAVSVKSSASAHVPQRAESTLDAVRMAFNKHKQGA